MTTQMPKRHLLVGRTSAETDLRQLIAQGHILVAENTRAFKHMSALGIECLSAETLLTPKAKERIVTQVGQTLAELTEVTSGADCSPELEAIYLANVAKGLFTYFAARHIETTAKITLYRPQGKGVQPFARRPPERIIYAHNALGRRLPAILDKGEYELDLRSPSGQKIAATATLPRWHLRLTTNPPAVNRLSNIIPPVFKGAKAQNVMEWSVLRLNDASQTMALPIVTEQFDPEIQALLADVFAETAAGFQAYYAGMEDFLRIYGAPQRAFFNHVGHQGYAGFAAALKDAGVPCEMSSHGALVDYGDTPRHRAARILVQAIYNDFPSMTQIAPRSPLQAKSAGIGRGIVKKVRLKPQGEQRRAFGGFRVYYAPNFQPWQECFHGMTIDCFESFRCIEKMVEVIKATDGFELDLRIKTTIKDKATKNKIPKSRGLLPADVAHFIDPERGVFDASVGSHSQFMDQSDLVVTEGLTAVMFEALEARKPLLLLLPHGGMLPSLPHKLASELVEDSERGAVYAASKDDDLGTILTAIAHHHKGKPLQDIELSPFIWVKGLNA